MREEYYDAWFRKYRGMELSDLVLSGIKTLLAKGAVTSDDMRAVPLKGDPRIRGGAIKALVSLGLATKAEQVNSTSDVCHKRPIQRFVLRDARVCQAILQRYQGAILGGIPSGCTQRLEQETFDAQLSIKS